MAQDFSAPFTIDPTGPLGNVRQQVKLAVQHALVPAGKVNATTDEIVRRIHEGILGPKQSSDIIESAFVAVKGIKIVPPKDRGMLAQEIQTARARIKATTTGGETLEALSDEIALQQFVKDATEKNLTPKEIVEHLVTLAEAKPGETHSAKAEAVTALIAAYTERAAEQRSSPPPEVMRHNQQTSSAPPEYVSPFTPPGTLTSMPIAGRSDLVRDVIQQRLTQEAKSKFGEFLIKQTSWKPLQSLGLKLAGKEGTRVAATAAANVAPGLMASIGVWGPPALAIVVVLFIAILAGGMFTAEVKPLGSGKAGGPIDGNVSNPFVDVVKTGNPAKLDDPTGKIEYTYSITAKQGGLTNVSVTSDEVVVMQESGTREFTLTAPSPPTEVESTWTSDEPYSFTLTSDMDDAIVTNTITITATAPNGEPQTVQASFSTIIGVPPTACFVLNSGSLDGITSANWDSYPGEKAKEMAAIGIVLAKLGANNVCGGPINLYIALSGVDVNYGGWHPSSGNIALDFTDDDPKSSAFGQHSLGTQANANYVLAHEVGHELDDRLPAVYAAFIQANLVYWNGSCEKNIYPFPRLIGSEAECYSENFAEGLAIFVEPSKGNRPPNWSEWLAFFQSHFP